MCGCVFKKKSLCKMRHGEKSTAPIPSSTNAAPLPVLQIFKSTYSKRWQAVHFAEPGSQ